LHPKALSVNINKQIWDIYFKELLPLFVKPGDDGNYPSTAASDLACLQVRRWLSIHNKISSTFG